ncbi:MAG: cytochrome b5 domain-containing protein [Polyangiales bacterium]
MASSTRGGRDARRPPIAPAELALKRLERRSLRARSENAGFLSASRGFLPRATPLAQLDPHFAAWDELAAELPALYRKLTVRQRVDALPLLDASAHALPASQLLRAASLLAIVSHAYWYVDGRTPSVLPPQLKQPWAEVRARLGRGQEVISYIDLIVYNWRVRDPRLGEPMVVENLDLLFPTIGNQEERVFYLTQVEILARTIPVVRLAAAAQSAVLREDDEELEAALIGMIDCLAKVVGAALPKINPNPYARTHVDPVVWAKTVAPFAVPMHRGDQGPSGTSSPLFNALDIFFGRRDFASFLGREIKSLRGTYPVAWQVYLRALGKVSVAEYIHARGSRALAGAYQEAFELYASEAGFLGRHRMKVYGFLELAFKVGRAVTIGGFGGVFTDRTWDLVDDALSEAQSERTRQLPSTVHRARVVSVEPGPNDPDAGVRRVTLDIASAGVRYHSGDRCVILPENEPALVARTLRALGAEGDEVVKLSAEWRAYGRQRTELAGHRHIPLAALLRYGAIRPVSPRLAEALHARTQSPFLFDAIVRGATEQWELWELLVILRAQGIDPATLWQAEDESLSRLIPPQRFRVYSISSAPRSPLRRAENMLELTVGQLRYAAPHADRDAAPESALREGTASTFLTRAQVRGLEVPFRIEHPEVFRLPDDPATPIVMFAGGSGLAPFSAFLEERGRSSRSGENRLFLSVRTPADFANRALFGSLRERGRLSLAVAFTRTGAEIARGVDGRIVLRPGPTRRVSDVMLAPENAAELARLALPVDEGGAGAHFYICGRGGFAESVMQTLRVIFERYGARAGSSREASEQLYRMVGERRLSLEIHTDAQPVEDQPRLFDVSEIAAHNDAAHGYWIVIDRVVYDVTDFIELHPGGRRVVQAYAGMDATHGFARAHNQRADVDAWREVYRIGLVRTLRFDDDVIDVDGPEGPRTVDCASAYRAFAKALQLVVEMQNALAADQSSLLEATADDPYTYLKAVETHRRFLKNYFGVLANQTLPELWRVAQPLFFAGLEAGWMNAWVAAQAETEAARVTEEIARHAYDDFESLGDLARRRRMVRAFAADDAWFLRALKLALARAVRAFERHGADVRVNGAARVRRACQQAASCVRRYHDRASRVTARSAPPRVAHDGRLASPPAAVEVRRLHTGEHWTVDEYPIDRLVVLRRTARPVGTLAALAEENERVLALLGPAHRAFGLVVDTRQARLRNDAGFEGAMAKLRHALTAHFRRIAILLESNIGHLQVSRIERDERRHAIATRSESAAFKFAQGADIP